MRFILVLVLSLLSNIAFAAPSFDCDGELSPVESATCSDSELSMWDKALSQTYKMALSYKDHDPNTDVDAYKKGLINEQRNWLINRDKACIKEGKVDKNCLLALYKTRSDEIVEKYMCDTTICQNALVFKDLDKLKKQYEIAYNQASRSVSEKVALLLKDRKAVFEKFAHLTCWVPAEINQGTSSGANAAYCEIDLYKREISWYSYFSSGNIKDLVEGGRW